MGDLLTRTPGRRLLAVALTSALVAAGCGGDDDKQEPQGVDLTALRCPLVGTGEFVAGSEKLKPADDAFDTKELIGKPLPEAEQLAGDHGCEIVVSMEDGKGLPVPTEVVPTRIFVYTEQGKVSQIEGVGGGL